MEESRENHYNIQVSVQFSSRSVVSYSLQPHKLENSRLPCPSPTARVYPNPCPLCRDAIQASHPLPSPSPPALSLSQNQGLFQWVSLLHQVAKNIGTSASVLPVNIQDRFPLGWTDWISLQSKGLTRVFSDTTVQKHQFFGTQLSL